MSYDDQKVYPYDTHFHFVDSVASIRAAFSFLFEDTFTCTYFNHVQPFSWENLTDRPDLYSFDVWDENGRGDQLLPSVGHLVADYFVFKYGETQLFHIAWWGRTWHYHDKLWRPITNLPHEYRANLHVGFLPQEGDDETGAPPLPNA